MLPKRCPCFGEERGASLSTCLQGGVLFSSSLRRISNVRYILLGEDATVVKYPVTAIMNGEGAATSHINEGY